MKIDDSFDEATLFLMVVALRKEYANGADLDFEQLKDAHRLLEDLLTDHFLTDSRTSGSPIWGSA
tara:strand:- start:1030 stop:1224 length:195 start_codon:yes stop_codon:yes gene_type:complete